MNFESTQTLQVLMQHPLRRAQKINIPAFWYAKHLASVNKNADSVLPDDEALAFYALNQIVSLICARRTPMEKLLPEEAKAVNLYVEVLEDQHTRLSHYTYLVFTREYRHAHNPAIIANTFADCAPLTAFCKKVHDSTNEDTLNSWLAETPKAIEIGRYCEAIRYCFDHGGWGGGYGGKPWGNITLAFERYVTGQTSAEVFIDTAYTLAHNNGPMFNKGMMYDNYTPRLYKILDVQRAGMVVEGLFEGSLKFSSTRGKSIWNTGGLASLVSWAQKEFGLSTFVNWHIVQNLGSLKKYPSEIAAMEQAHGPKVKPKVDFNGQKAIFTGKHFYVTDEEDFKIMERVTE